MRKQYHVVPFGELSWQVKHAGSVLSNHHDKDNAIEAAKLVAKQNVPSQVVVHGRDGVIQYEHTYGDDPVKYPG
jgi:hypothetical protein